MPEGNQALEGIIGIVRAPMAVDLLRTASALAEGGVRTLELTLNTPGALDAIDPLRRMLPTTMIGVGTILRPADAEAAIDAGAQFIVTPTFQPDTVPVCRHHRVTLVCGAMTPTEILAAHDTGADYVKLFPAGMLGLDYIRAVRGPLPFVRIVPTGGVTLENVADFLRLCPAVGVGTSMVPVEWMQAGRWSDLTERARAFAEAAADR